ncbi:hypothetical protein IGS61_09620 [Janthinobacterium sp. FW305-129]|uniref:hypothetical protein n=1 Tax=Janthinobacterium sp. FW305-129 TaxID=2775054 RepID=UPI001E2F5174|nr:hypothetical protein [Janthinobacterium sp. FW305-129]MCC7597744.1 hypothetical protein [Janthinobacterium sp. FW305-129]
MTNLRIIHHNASDLAVITASSQSGGLTAANLLTDIKSEVWRSTGTSATLRAVFPSTALIGALALPFCNLSSAATLRVRGYVLASDSTPAFDTGTVQACAHQPLGAWDWGLEPLGVNAFSYGGGAYGRIWFAPAWVEKLEIDIDDALNPAGYIEASRLVAGMYWSPESNADYGASVTADDASQHYRNEGGDLLTNVGPRSRKLALSLTAMSPPDRSKLMAILRGNGKSRPVFISLFPESDDPLLEQDHQVYGKLPEAIAVTTPQFERYSTSITVEEI